MYHELLILTSTLTLILYNPLLLMTYYFTVLVVVRLFLRVPQLSGTRNGAVGVLYLDGLFKEYGPLAVQEMISTLLIEIKKSIYNKY